MKFDEDTTMSSDPISIKVLLLGYGYLEEDFNRMEIDDILINLYKISEAKING